mgnify:CR=1 FL=1
MNHAAQWMTGLVVAALLAGCTPVPYNPATSTDTTPPKVALRIEGAGSNAIEVTNWDPANPQNKSGTANPNATLKLLATATDNESGIKEVKLSVLRTVKYLSSSGLLVDNRMASVTVDSRSYALNNGQAPSMGAIQLTVVPSDQFVFMNNGQAVTGVGVVLEYNVEAKNQNGQTAHTERLVISSGRLQ